MPQHFAPGRNSCTHQIVGWVWPRGGMDSFGAEKISCPCWDMNSGQSTLRQVTTPAALSRIPTIIEGWCVYTQDWTNKHSFISNIQQDWADTSLHFYLLTYLLTPRSRILLEKLTSSQLVKKFPAFYGIRKFITAFTTARHLSLSWASSIQSMPSHPTLWRPILILSSHLRMGLPSCFFPSGFPTKPLYTTLLSQNVLQTPLILFQLITQTNLVKSDL